MGEGPQEEKELIDGLKDEDKEAPRQSADCQGRPWFFLSFLSVLFFHCLACPWDSGLDGRTGVRKKGWNKNARRDLEKEVVYEDLTSHLHVLLALLLHSSLDAK